MWFFSSFGRRSSWMYRVRIPIWMVQFQLFWERFHWHQTKCQQLRRTLMFRNRLRLFKIHHWHPHNQYRQLARLMEPDGIFIHRFVSLIYIHCYFQSISFSKLYCSLAAPPIFTESGYRGNMVNKNESQYMRMADGQNDFAPRYPVYSAQNLPQLPNTQQ